ncbi:MAG: phospho-N-acetylmuramoyl-pentapeptide-transferase [Candidatus Eremiobacteraeota bacterium]|nr:phospho-N-acetylmuramoyl-pentapeptide-transferase [Candidatus Eremiobacteraeota bacterium]MBV8354050.1 phospho-N-acetylmuramoyl-pentapeptide-transferase [Candidatus Eremiobacteraeota bacterium]
MTVAAIAFGLSFLGVLALGKPLIAFLTAASAEQTVYEDAPASHQSKTGTPTMGGVLFLAGALVAVLLEHSATVVALVFLVAACAAIGALDDVLGIRLGRNRGLRARTKLLLTALAGALFLYMLARAGELTDPAIFGLGHPGTVVAVLLDLCAIVATTHAVNLTDGLDGLAGGAILPPLAVVAAVAYTQGRPDIATFELAMLGAVAAFLFYNLHPAKVFMGDTGSLALGAALSGGAIVTGMPLLLLLIGGVFAAETLSVILQVASYKMTKRRIFLMSPLHHHFELAGWPEAKVTARFWFASGILSILGFALTRLAHA